jgi:hypothetical protein
VKREHRRIMRIKKRRKRREKNRGGKKNESQGEDLGREEKG